MSATAYLTLSDALLKFKLDQLAERASPDGDVTGATLEAFVSAGMPEDAENHDALAAAVALINGRIADANAVVDGYALARGRVNVADLPAPLVAAATAIFAFSLFGSDEDDIDGRKAVYNDALRFLIALSRGEAELAGGDANGHGADMIEAKGAAPSVFAPTTDAFREFMHGI